jgi:hypothetical protein
MTQAASTGNLQYAAISSSLTHGGSKRDSRFTGQTLALGAALTSSWTGFRVAGLNIADYLLVAAVIAVLLAALIHRRRLPIPGWAVLPPLALLLIALFGSVVRGDSLTSPRAQRAWIVGNAVSAEYGGALPLVARMTLSLTAVAIIVAGASSNSKDPYGVVRRIIYTWAVGAAVSSAYGVAQSLGVQNLPFLVYYNAAGRITGLAHHPNSLGQTIALALPVLIYMASAMRGIKRVIIAFLLLISVYALYLSGSRSALLAGVALSIITFVYFVSSSKRISVGTLLLATFAIPVGFVTLPAIVEGTRFYSENGQKSTAARMISIQRGLDFFFSNPLFGSGVGSWTGELVPLIVLSSGGIFYAAIFYSCITHPLVMRPRSSGGALVPILVISALGVFITGLLNNGLVERYQYWPFAALFALSPRCRTGVNSMLAQGRGGVLGIGGASLAFKPSRTGPGKTASAVP